MLVPDNGTDEGGGCQGFRSRTRLSRKTSRDHLEQASAAFDFLLVNWLKKRTRCEALCPWAEACMRTAFESCNLDSVDLPITTLPEEDPVQCFVLERNCVSRLLIVY